MTELMREIARYRERVEALAGRLGESPSEIEPERLREQIIALVREVDEAIAGLQGVREAVRPIAREVQQRFPRTRRSPVTRTDHLGSATFRERGWSALSAGEYARAVEELERAVQADPESAHALALLAWAHLRAGDRVTAAPLVARAAALAAEAPFVRLVTGILVFEEGRSQGAANVLAPLAAEAGEATVIAYAHLYLGRVYAGEARAREAQAHYRAAIQAAPNLTEAYWELGRSHDLEGRAALALEAWRAGAENRYNPWGERCRAEAMRVTGGGVV